jgi:hypothetical protein
MVRAALLAGAVIALATCTSNAASNVFGTRAQTTQQKIGANPLHIFVAEGIPNSCGQGCNRWIAIEGNFDRGSAQRVREFLTQGTNRTLPVYFHSKGGWIDEGLKVGELLRELRMTAGVGRTSLPGCAGLATAAACRKLAEKGEVRNARLRFSEGTCDSSCSFALLGASRRSIDTNSRVGIHRPGRAVHLVGGSMAKPNPAAMALLLRTQEEFIRRDLLEYSGRMGIDPAFVDLTYASDANSVRYLTRAELDRFGVVSKPAYETPWTGRDEKPTPAYTVFKAVSRATPITNMPLTTIVGVTCYGLDRVTIFIERELDVDEAGREPVVHIVGDDQLVWASGKKMAGKELSDYRSFRLSFEEVLKVIPKRSFELKLEYKSPELAARSETIKLSITGLEKELLSMKRRCENFK